MVACEINQILENGYNCALLKNFTYIEQNQQFDSYDNKSGPKNYI